MSKRFAFRCAILPLFVLALGAWADEKEMAPEMRPPTSAPATRPAVEAIKALNDLAARPLLLTTDGTSTHARYSYAVAINPPEGGEGQSTTVLVVRDGDHFGIVVGANGLPCYYMTDGLLVAVDRKNPGQLAMHEGGSKAKRAFDAIMTMGKIDVAEIERAVREV